MQNVRLASGCCGASPDVTAVMMTVAHMRGVKACRCIRGELQRTAMKQRVRALLRTQRAKKVARKHFENLRKTCKEVVQKKGAATRG